MSSDNVLDLIVSILKLLLEMVLEDVPLSILQQCLKII